MLTRLLPSGMYMSPSSSAIYEYIVKGFASTGQAPGDTPITIVCEPLRMQGGSPAHARISMRFMAGTSPDAARAIARTLQAKVKGLYKLEALGDEAA